MENNILSQAEITEINRRRAICATCPFMSKNMPNYNTSRTDDHCTLCGCPIENKTACLECDCGIEFYNKSHVTPLPLKWTAYKHKNESSEYTPVGDAPTVRVLP